jgi:hypothetical protein
MEQPARQRMHNGEPIPPIQAIIIINHKYLLSYSQCWILCIKAENYFESHDR